MQGASKRARGRLGADGAAVAISASEGEEGEVAGDAGRQASRGSA